jgi:Ca-activated chloride channel family protein
MNDQPDQVNHDEEQAARLTAFALGELSEAEQQQIELELSPRQREAFDETERVSLALRHSDRAAPLPEPSAELRAAIESRLSGDMVMVELNKPNRDLSSRGRWLIVLSTGLLLLVAVVAASSFWNDDVSRSIATKTTIMELRQKNAELRVEAKRADDHLAIEQAGNRIPLAELEGRQKEIAEQLAQQYEALASKDDATIDRQLATNTQTLEALGREVNDLRAEIHFAQQDRDDRFANVGPLEPYKHVASATTPTPAPIIVTAESAHHQGTTTYQVLPSTKPHYATTPAQNDVSDAGVMKGGRALGVQAVPSGHYLSDDVQYFAPGPEFKPSRDTAAMNAYKADPASPSRRVSNSEAQGILPEVLRSRELHAENLQPGVVRFGMEKDVFATEFYSPISENRFLSVTDSPLSTFSIDVDTASYANTRRFLTQNQLPPANAIRIEEFINYFSYAYPEPTKGEPFSVSMELVECPWQPAHQLVRIGLKGKDVPQEKRPASNIVFLLDVSGSMQNANKLPLLKQAMKLLTDQLTESDRVSIVTYAGNAGLALDTTNGESKQVIREAIDALNANGSTNGSAGIQLAYEKATESFIKEGANRVILATDGDLNVGVTSDDALVELIKAKAASGVFLTVLGFGEGNLKDGKLEKLADNGNGMYAYIDSLREARKVLVEQLTGSLVTIAKDVKIKVEFNPAEVAAYRLLGYENRLMSAPDFDNDAKDAGEIGAGHTVTALYEIVPSKAAEQLTSTATSLKYQRPTTPAEPPKELTAAAETGELLTLFLRYKQPDADESTLREFTVENKRRAFDDASTDFRFAAAVASFAMVLRNSEFQGNSTLAGVEEIASSAIGSDPQGHRTEFLDLVRKASTLQPPRR